MNDEWRTLYLARALYDAVEDCNIQYVSLSHPYMFLVKNNKNLLKKFRFECHVNAIESYHINVSIFKLHRPLIVQQLDSLVHTN